MSVDMMSLVFKCNMPELKTDKGVVVSDSSCKFVLLALADHANDEGEGAYPSVKRICHKTNLSTGTVVNALNALRTNGFTRLDGRSKRDTYNYTILVAEIARFQWLESPDSSHQNPTIPVARTESSINHPKKPSKREGASAPPRPSQLPEILLYREVTGQYPAKASMETVLLGVTKVQKRIGRVALAEDLLPFYRAWCDRGYNPRAVTWLEWAASGNVPTNGRSTNYDSNMDILRDFAERRAQ